VAHRIRWQQPIFICALLRPAPPMCGRPRHCSANREYMTFRPAESICRHNGRSGPMMNRWKNQRFVGSGSATGRCASGRGRPALDNRTIKATRAVRGRYCHCPNRSKTPSKILRLSASGSLNLDCPCRLPRMRPEGLFWQEGGITLIVPDPLLIERLTLLVAVKRPSVRWPSRG